MLKNSDTNLAVVVLAAGVGKRMNSSLPKVLHEIGGKPIILRTFETLAEIRPDFILTVVNKNNISQIKALLGSKTNYCLQEKQLGTGDAVKTALSQMPEQIKLIAVLYGDDTAFYKPETILKILEKHHRTNAKITFVTLIKDNPKGLGRIVRNDFNLAGIVEEKDATPSQLKIKEVNDGLYVFNKDWIISQIDYLKPSPVTGEYYLTDLIERALKNNNKVETFTLDDLQEWHGVNTQEELISANKKHAETLLPKHIHMMGISGAGAAAVAGIAESFGYSVTGCDLGGNSSYTEGTNIKIQKGHSPSHLARADMLVISPAVTKLDPKNEEVIKAKEVGIPIMTWQEFQGQYLQAGKYVICIAGAYGKSTTTTMIAKILIDLGLDPTVEIGARVTEWNSNFKIGKSKYYICEADEYNNNFLGYYPDIAVILNMGWDHPDFFKTRRAVVETYKRFINQMKPNGILIIQDDPNEIALIRGLRKDIKIIKVGNYGAIKLSIIGDFRKENANAALTVASVLNLNTSKAKEALESFKGIGRRLEFKGEIAGVNFYDDYAVQPYTVLKTVSALSDKFSKQKIALVFEPHTFSRINKFFDDFIQSLKNIDVNHIYVTNVYAAREKGDPEKLSRKMTEAIGAKATYSGSIEQTAKLLKSEIKSYDVVLTMGAGNVYKIFESIKNG